MKEVLNLYNHFNNGDIFYSRMLIKILSPRFKINYYHNNPTPILTDIDDLDEINGVIERWPFHGIIIEENVLNTWIGCDHLTFLGAHGWGCFYENYFELCKYVANHFSLEIPSYDDLLPTIDYLKLPNIEKVKENLTKFTNSYKKIILVSTGPVNSSQSCNFDFTNIINTLSIEYPDFLFLTTTHIDITNKNVLFTENITNTKTDLLYISYISTKCDMIIGRTSGPYCYSQVKENLMNPNKIFISFSNIQQEARYFPNQESKVVWSNNYDEENIINTIKKNL